MARSDGCVRTGRYLGEAFWSRIARAGVLALITSCAGGTHPPVALSPQSCEFIVYNRTPYALEVRLRTRRLSTTLIGALNPGELLSYAVPCALGRVWVAGIPIPSQVGARVSFSVVQEQTTLVAGQRAEVALQWP